MWHVNKENGSRKEEKNKGRNIQRTCLMHHAPSKIWVSTIPSVVLTADDFQLFIKYFCFIIGLFVVGCRMQPKHRNTETNTKKILTKICVSTKNVRLLVHTYKKARTSNVEHRTSNHTADATSRPEDARRTHHDSANESPETRNHSIYIQIKWNSKHLYSCRDLQQAGPGLTLFAFASSRCRVPPASCTDRTCFRRRLPYMFQTEIPVTSRYTAAVCITDKHDARRIKSSRKQTRFLHVHTW